MNISALRKQPISTEEILGLAIAIAVIGGIGASLLFPHRPALFPAQTGWNQNLLRLAQQAQAGTNSAQPTPNTNSWLPQLPTVQLPGLPQPNLEPRQRASWQIQATPCQTPVQGNHWSRTDGMFHCLVK